MSMSNSRTFSDQYIPIRWLCGNPHSLYSVPSNGYVDIDAMSDGVRDCDRCICSSYVYKILGYIERLLASVGYIPHWTWDRQTSSRTSCGSPQYEVSQYWAYVNGAMIGLGEVAEWRRALWQGNWSIGGRKCLGDGLTCGGKLFSGIFSGIWRNIKRAWLSAIERRNQEFWMWSLGKKLNCGRVTGR